MQRSVLVACHAKASITFDLIGHLLRNGRKVVTVGELHIAAGRTLKRLKNLTNLEIRTDNISQPLLEMANVDQIYHLACPTKEQYEDDPVQALELCFIGTKNLLDVALRCNARVVLASISTSTRRQASPPLTPAGSWGDRLRQRKRKRAPENLTPITKRRRTTKVIPAPPANRSYYDEGNRLAEMLCSAYEEHFGLDVRIAHMPTADQLNVPRKASEGVDSGNVTLTVDLPATPTESEDGTTILPSIETSASLRALVDSMDSPTWPRPVSGGPITD